MSAHQPTYLDSNFTTITCPKCSTQSNLMQYLCFDLANHPEWKKALMDPSFFLWSCPNCDASSMLTYPSRCIDDKQKLCVVLRPGIEQENIPAVLLAMGGRMSGLGMSDWRHRVVGNFYAMQEQVCIREADLDDRVVHLLKPLIIGQMQSMGKEVWNGFFNHVDSNPQESSHDNVLLFIGDGDHDKALTEPVAWFDIHLTNGEVEKQGINWMAYKMCEQMLADSEATNDTGEFLFFDLSWAIRFHNTSHNERSAT